MSDLTVGTTFSFEDESYQRTLLSQQLLTNLGKDLASLVKRWENDYEKIEGQKLDQTPIGDFVLDVIATIEERCKGIYPDIKHRITKYFESLQSKGTKFVGVKDVRKIFTDEEIRHFMSWNLPKGWDHGGPSSVQMTYEWMEKNFDDIIRLESGNLIHYFYFTGKL